MLVRRAVYPASPVLALPWSVRMSFMYPSPFRFLIFQAGLLGFRKSLNTLKVLIFCESQGLGLRPLSVPWTFNKATWKCGCFIGSTTFCPLLSQKPQKSSFNAVEGGEELGRKMTTESKCSSGKMDGLRTKDRQKMSQEAHSQASEWELPDRTPRFSLSRT